MYNASSNKQRLVLQGEEALSVSGLNIKSLTKQFIRNFDAIRPVLCVLSHKIKKQWWTVVNDTIFRPVSFL